MDYYTQKAIIEQGYIRSRINVYFARAGQEGTQFDTNRPSEITTPAFSPAKWTNQFELTKRYAVAGGNSTVAA
jgi:hypothetical protein